MSSEGLTSGEEFLREAAQKFFSDLYEHPAIHINEEFHKDLLWTPTLRFVVNHHINVFVEVNETGPYPQIVRMRHANLLQIAEPIAVYAVCPEEMILTPAQRKDTKEMRAHGYGLLTVNDDGDAEREFTASPLVQVIPRAEYKAIIAGLPKSIRQQVSQAYEDYNGKPVNGVSKITEIVEGLVNKACDDVVRKKYADKKDFGINIAANLDKLYALEQCGGARPAIGGVRSYYSTYRNLTHHWPKNKAKAHKKYADCRHAFMDGLKNIEQFTTSMKNSGLTGKLKT